MAAPWKERYKSVESLPGGYLRYLDTLEHICMIVDQHRLSKDELISFLQSEFNQKRSHDSHLKENFLLRTNLLEEEAGLCVVGGWTRRWLYDNEVAFVIALIHRRIRFVGEMLAELQKTPRSAAELLWIANEKYGFAWRTHTQIDIRRGWLQSAGFIEMQDGRKLAITETGRFFLGWLGMAPAPPKPVQAPEPVPEPAPVDEPPSPRAPTPPDELPTEIEESSADSGDPHRFERAVCDAFSYLGFQSELLSGSGKTDVLLTARLGRTDSYKVTVDAKTVGAGRLTDGQVDWATLVEHRDNEGADHSLLVGPNPSGERLFTRAARFGVTVLSARRLAKLCRGHARAPLGLDNYRSLFTTHGEADITEIRTLTAASRRLRGVAADVCEELAKNSETAGYLTARELWILMLRRKASTEKSATEIDIQSVLDTLASPLVGAVHGDPEKGYVLATDPEVVQLRLTLLGAELVGPVPG